MSDTPKLSALALSFVGVLSWRDPKSNRQVLVACIDSLLMTIEVTPRATAGACRCHGFSQFHLTKITRDFAKLRAMHGPTEYDLQAAATPAGNEGDIDCELRFSAMFSGCCRQA